MGVYETLFRFADATGMSMGDAGTHPWAQGFPLTTRLPGGPALPESVSFTATDLKYPKADGQPLLREAIAATYREHYGARITADNVAVFAGGRPALFAILAFLLPGTTVAVEETEYTPYWDVLRLLDTPTVLIPSRVENRFRPSGSDYDVAPLPGTSRVLLLKSNPCNPTGVATTGAALADLVRRFSAEGRGAVLDEAYEYFLDPEPESALRHIEDIDATNLFVVGAATKGLQAPGLRIGWCIAAKRHIEIFRNYSSLGMGGVSRLSQLCATDLLEPARVRQARKAVSSFFGEQRRRYAEGLSALGLELFTGEGGFYHWARLPKGLSGDAFNERLFPHRAAILPGRLCDMNRLPGGGPSVLDPMFRFSFGPLAPESLKGDLEILRRALG
jgi:aspartate/methionine/tyrosine aminotransferase